MEFQWENQAPTPKCRKMVGNIVRSQIAAVVKVIETMYFKFLRELLKNPRVKINSFQPLTWVIVITANILNGNDTHGSFVNGSLQRNTIGTKSENAERLHID